MIRLTKRVRKTYLVIRCGECQSCMFVHIIYEQFMHRQKSVAFLDCQIIAITFLFMHFPCSFLSPVQRDLCGQRADKQLRNQFPHNCFVLSLLIPLVNSE